jgi:hypothetical protein
MGAIMNLPKRWETDFLPRTRFCAAIAVMNEGAAIEKWRPQ